MSARTLVVDTSIARSAGGDAAAAPVSCHCRDFLLAMRTVPHRVAITPDIRDEWRRHQSHFARAWLVSMYARKLVVALQPCSDPALRRAISTKVTTETQRLAMLKDCHLIEAARATDRIVASLDETVKSLFTSTCREIAQFREVIWINPTKPEEKSIAWLNAGAPAERARMLEAFLV
jgi:hypothetical protein